MVHLLLLTAQESNRVDTTGSLNGCFVVCGGIRTLAGVRIHLRLDQTIQLAEARRKVVATLLLGDGVSEYGQACSGVGVATRCKCECFRHFFKITVTSAG